MIRYFILWMLWLGLLWGEVLAQERVYTNISPNLNPQECLKMAQLKEQAGDKKEATRYLNQAANIEWEAKNYSQAINYFEKSIHLNQVIGNINGVAMLNNNLGVIYADMKEYTKSLHYFQKTLFERRKLGEKNSIISSLINMAVVSNNLKKFNESAVYLEEALVNARELNDPAQMRSCYGMLSETYEKAGNTSESLRYFNLYRSFHEESQRRKEKEYISMAEKARLEAIVLENKKKIAELEVTVKEKELLQKDIKLNESDKSIRNLTDNLSNREIAIKYLEKEAETRKKDVEIKDLKIKEIRAKNQVRAERDKLIRNSLFMGLIFLGIFGLFMIVRYQEKRRNNLKLATQNHQILLQQEKILDQNKQLEGAFREIKVKNENITASITYAKRIQRSMAISTEQIAQSLPQHFIMWKPRDIVSGDFYWFAEKNKKIIIAVADCTGHGVPGAFVSMLGDSLLNQIVHDRKIYEPDKILNALHVGIRNSLNQIQTDNKDGMDIAICVIDLKKQTMEYAGAHNPLIYIQNNELQQIKADEMGIGGYVKKKEIEMRKFTKHTIDISQPTYFYLFSDGFQDQFGGVKDSKFMIRRLRELFFDIHQKPLLEQGQILAHTIEDWIKVGNTRQIDDILVFGAKIDLQKTKSINN